MEGADLILEPTVDTGAEDANRSTDEPTTLAVTAAWFAAPICRNCGAACDTPYCCRCGQKAAKRYVWRDIGAETWERVRLFEHQALKTVGRLIVSPGAVAREYVMGKRASHMHPLKLLVALVALLVLMLAANRYFGVYGFAGKNADVDRMAKRVIAYANWSFSLGIFAIFAGSWIVLRGRLGYNAIEHAVLAVYVQAIILAAILANMLPTLIWREPGFILWHKAASQYYIFAIKLLIVGAAYKQFFLLKPRADWPRLLAACAIFAGVGWVLVRLYAALILWLVSRTT